MKRAWNRPVAVLAVVVVVVASLGAVVFAVTNTDRADCPGKIVCPLTGELICRDKCPTVDPNRADCPGQIVCPLTGKLVCKDRCPLGNPSASTEKTDAKPSCCRKPA